MTSSMDGCPACVCEPGRCRQLHAPQWVHDADFTRLTTRERDVLVALGECLANMDIARRCFISERTAKKHVASIFEKLEISSRAEAAVIAAIRTSELRFLESVLSDTGGRSERA